MLQPALLTWHRLRELQVQYHLNYLADHVIPGLTPKQKVDMFVHIRQGYGRSALLLSGGAGLGVHHFGVIKVLWEQGLLPRVVSGSSAGSLVGSIICTASDAELEIVSPCQSLHSLHLSSSISWPSESGIFWTLTRNECRCL